MHHIKLKVPSFAPFVTGVIDNIKMTVHKYHNVWVSHRMNYEPRKLMDAKHSCVNGLICDNDINVIVGFKFTGNHSAYSVFSPVMSLRDFLRPCARIIDDDNPSRVLDFWFENCYMKFKRFFGDKRSHLISPVKHWPDMSYVPYVHKRSSYHYFSHSIIKVIVTDDITVTFKPCR